MRAVGEWLSINGEAIYNTRKWEVTHEGPSNLEMNGTNTREQHKGIKVEFTPEDFWFTKKGNSIYAISLENNKAEVYIKSISKGKNKVKNITLLGFNKEVKWEHTIKGLHVKLPNRLPSEIGYVLRITLE